MPRKLRVGSNRYYGIRAMIIAMLKLWFILGKDLEKTYHSENSQITVVTKHLNYAYGPFHTYTNFQITFC